MADRDSIPHIPALRFGKEYESLDTVSVASHRDGTVLAEVSQVNAGIIRRDLKKHADENPLADIPAAELVTMSARAATHFLEEALPLNEDGASQTPDEYVAVLSATSGMPYTLCRANMQKVAGVMREIPGILYGLMRGLPLGLLDEGFDWSDGAPISFARSARNLGVVLPSNSPGVNSIWMPAVALKTPVVLKPGREEPWTPLRVMRAFIAAGVPREAFSFYPTDHEGAAAILEECDRAQLFGDDSTTRPYASNPAIEIHGAGRSKVILGEDQIDDWNDHLDILLESIALNGGRSCINASSIFVPSRGDEIADALARRLSEITPRPHDDDGAKLSAFANPKFAEFIDASIENGLAQGGAEDVTARYRDGDRAQTLGGGDYLAPTIVRCDDVEHPLANTEFLFPFASVVEVPQAEMLERIGPSLVVSAITKDPTFVRDLLESPSIDRLNLGPVPTTRVSWDQPHEGNLFEFLYQRRAIHRMDGW